MSSQPLVLCSPLARPGRRRNLQPFVFQAQLLNGGCHEHSPSSGETVSSPDSSCAFSSPAKETLAHLNVSPPNFSSWLAPLRLPVTFVAVPEVMFSNADAEAMAAPAIATRASATAVALAR